MSDLRITTARRRRLVQAVGCFAYIAGIGMVIGLALLIKSVI